jgi:hypothetical protein
MQYFGSMPLRSVARGVSGRAGGAHRAPRLTCNGWYASKSWVQSLPAAT